MVDRMEEAVELRVVVAVIDGAGGVAGVRVGVGVGGTKMKTLVACYSQF